MFNPFTSPDSAATCWGVFVTLPYTHTFVSRNTTLCNMIITSTRMASVRITRVVTARECARTRSAAELERFLSAYDLPVLTYLRDTQLYVQVAANGMTLFDFPGSRVEKDIEQWRPIIDWAGSD